MDERCGSGNGADDWCDQCSGLGGQSRYVDANGDGVCDNRTVNWVDANGDGICDNRGTNGQGAGYVDADGDGVCDNRAAGGGMMRGQERGMGRGAGGGCMR